MIGKLLGYTNVHMTARYAHLANDPLKSAANRIANRIAEVSGEPASGLSMALGDRVRPWGIAVNQGVSLPISVPATRRSIPGPVSTSSRPSGSTSAEESPGALATVRARHLGTACRPSRTRDADLGRGGALAEHHRNVHVADYVSDGVDAPPGGIAMCHVGGVVNAKIGKRPA